jgi:aspartyl-tRNA synthetase
MSFVNADDVMKVTEDMLLDVVENLYPDKKIVEKPFPRYSWEEVMNRW